jgi:hypothetical protein
MAARSIKGKVRAVYPDAYSHSWADRWTIYESPAGAGQGHAIGDGRTARKAWLAAWSRIASASGVKSDA